MRRPRNFQTDRCYHLISRVAHRAFYLDEDERTRFVERMRRVAYFSCVEILAYCVMSNHFHVLVYVPAPRELCGDEVLARVQALYAGARLADLPGTRAVSAATRQQLGGALSPRGSCRRSEAPGRPSQGGLWASTFGNWWRWFLDGVREPKPPRSFPPVPPQNHERKENKGVFRESA